MRVKRIGFLFTVIILSQMFLIAPSLIVAAVDGQDLAEDSLSINVKLQEEFFRAQVTGGLQGYGDDEGSRIDGVTDQYPLENAIAFAAFYNRYARSGIASMDDWASGSILVALSALEAGEVLEREDEPDVYYTSDQGAALEFMSEGYQKSQNQQARVLMEKIYNKLYTFESSGSDLTGFGYDNAYWRAIDDNGNQYLPNNALYKYCFINATLWAIIGMLNFGMTVKGQEIDRENEYSINSINRAEAAIEFCEDYCFFNGSGFKEYPFADMASPATKYYYFNTQVLALLAYTRLYEATEKQLYLDKANMMVEYIITKNFLDTGNISGCVEWLSNGYGSKATMKLGYDNALYAYTLLTLYEATGEAEPKFLRRAEEITLFMNTHLYQESVDGQILGYVEYLKNGQIPPDTQNGQYRYFKTNGIMMFLNEEIVWYERPWYIKYLVWELVIGGALIIGIAVLILARKRSRRGTKIPKMVGGLLDEEA